MCVCRSALFYSSEIQQYTIPFMGSDPSVVKRTQRFLSEEYKQTPVSVRFSLTHTLLISAVLNINADYIYTHLYDQFNHTD